MKNIYILLLTIPVINFCAAQPSEKTSEIPLVRQYFHGNIDATQKSILLSDGKNPDRFSPTQNSELNDELTIALTTGVDNIQSFIEEDNSLDNNNKIKFLRGLNDALNSYKSRYIDKSAKPSILPDLLKAFKEGIDLEANNQSIEPVISRYAYDIGDILVKNIAYSNNAGVDVCRAVLILKYCEKNPDKILNTLSKYPNSPYTDSLILVAAHRAPDNVYTFAAGNNELAAKIQNNPDPLVKIIGRLAKMSSGRLFFPFLDNLYKNKISFEEIDSAMRDSTKYYKLLVQTQIDYTNRLRMKDTPLGRQVLTNRLAVKAVEVYVNTINALHESPDNIRFRVIEKLSPQELFYLAVMCEEEIYTSSYVRGVYPRIWQHKKMERGDSLLMSVSFDHFKKWIKMAENYNTLDNFLSRMEKENARILMKAFVRNLDKSGSLEDAVDVANSFASISDKNKTLRSLILSEVQHNLRLAEETNNKRAADIYSILNTLFLSIDSSNRIDVSKTLGIPPVYFMPNKNLRDTSGKIIVQQFFYGDKDGKTVFNSFLSSFSNSNWKINYTSEWVSVSSTNGTPVVIYANKPLDETQGLDGLAQADLNGYLAENNLEPVLVIHRGHSYWLPSTLNQLAPSAKVVLLGSCGAYQNLSKILAICPSAQIVASKQTGSGLVNHPMIYTILDLLRQGKDLNWPQLWSNLSKRLSNDLFADYVPPHKNLGAVFIMAYNKMQQKEEY